MGGIEMDENGATSVPGLYAAGEVTGGVDGANRLGGNALTNTIVFGARAGRSATEYAKSVSDLGAIDSDVRGLENDISEMKKRPVLTGARPRDIRKRLQRMMVKEVGVIRSGETLEHALEGIRELRESLSHIYATSPWELGEGLEVKAMITVAEVVARCALERKESRGAHYRLDYPQEDERWAKNITVQRQNSDMLLQPKSVVTTGS
jgi:succinate dehydrogenase/fumarate reductase flavoprotein subunit